MAELLNRKALLDSLNPNAADPMAIPGQQPAMPPSKLDLGAMSGTGGMAGGIAPGEGRPNAGPPPVLDQAIPAPAGAVQSAAAKPITLGSNGYSTTTPGRPFLMGFEASKLMDPNSGSAAGSKYTPAAKAFGQAYLGGTEIGRGKLDNMLSYLKANGFQNATSDGQQKIDFGDGNGLIDVIRSDGQIVFQNTTGNPTWEQKGYGGGGAPGGGGTGGGGAHGGGAGLPGQLQGDPMAMIQEALGKYGTSPNLQALLAQLGAA